MLRWTITALAFAILLACGAEPPPQAKSASEYIAMIDRDPRVAAIRIFVAPPVIKNDQWQDDDVPRIIRAALSDSLAAMGFTVVAMDNDADAIARIRVVVQSETQSNAYELEFLRGSYEVETFRLEDANLGYAGLGRDERVKRVYTRMIAARATTITRSSRITALAQRRATDPAASGAKSATPPPAKPPPVAAPPTAAERDKAVAWIQSTNKAGASSTIVATFTQQLDGIIGSGQDGQWQLGWGMTNDRMARIARWRAGSFETRAITPVEATQAGIAETSSMFTMHVRGSLAPLGPSSAPPPPAPAPAPPPPLPPNTETGTGRVAAVAWMNAHAKNAQTAASLIEQLDELIKAGTRGEWKIGWALTQTGKAYFFAYAADGAFQATELSLADAQTQGYKAYAVTFAKY